MHLLSCGHLQSQWNLWEFGQQMFFDAMYLFGFVALITCTSYWGVKGNLPPLLVGAMVGV